MSDRLTGTFDVSEFVCEERASEFTGDIEYSVDGEYWCESEAEAIAQFRQMQDNVGIIF